MPSGGYHPPTKPSPVSGPGAMSKRTDGAQATQALPDAKYGEQAAYQAQQQAAPMAASGPDLSQIVPFGAPTQRPSEPLTAGVSGGLGPGPSVPTSRPQIDPAKAERIRSYLPVLVMLASQDDADENTKQLVRQLRADLG